MFKKLLLFILPFAFGFVVRSQNTDTLSNNSFPRAILKIAPLSLVDFTPSLEFAFEYRIQRFTGIQLELGYIANSISGSPENLEGYRIRSEIRFYNKIYPSIYFAPEFMYKYYDYNTTGRFSMDDGAYTQIADYKVNKKIIAYHIKIGLQKPIKMNHYSPFIFDAYVGFGLRHITTTTVGKPQDGVETQMVSDFWGDKDGYSTYSSLALGFKLGYVF